jgi:hypothetical protein
MNSYTVSKSGIALSIISRMLKNRKSFPISIRSKAGKIKKHLLLIKRMIFIKPQQRKTNQRPKSIPEMSQLCFLLLQLVDKTSLFPLKEES